MGLSNYDWIVVHEDGSTETVVTDCLEEVAREIEVEQPVAVIRKERH